MRYLLAFALLSSLAIAQDDSPSALVWFYRVEEAPRMVKGKPKLRINGKESATFPEREYIGVRLKPGRYVLALGQPQSATALEVEAGKTYYIQVSYKPGGHGFNGLLDQIIIQAEAQGRLHFEKMKKALEPKNILDKSLDLVKTKPQ